MNRSKATEYHAASASRMMKAGRLAEARYHVMMSDALNRGKKPSRKERKAIFKDARKAVKAPFKSGKGKGYDVYPPSDKIALLSGLYIVYGPDNYPRKARTKKEAEDYVRVFNREGYPVRFHK